VQNKIYNLVKIITMAIGINLNDDFDYPKSETIYKPNDAVILTRAFKIFRDLGNGQFDVCDTYGNCLQVSEMKFLYHN